MALGIKDTIVERALVDINGIAVPVSPSHAHFADVNLLGADFFATARATLVLDYGRGLVSVMTESPPELK